MESMWLKFELTGTGDFNRNHSVAPRSLNDVQGHYTKSQIPLRRHVERCASYIDPLGRLWGLWNSESWTRSSRPDN